MTRRILRLVLLLIVLTLLPAPPVAADEEEEDAGASYDIQSVEDLLDNDWEEQDRDSSALFEEDEPYLTYCKYSSSLTEEDQDALEFESNPVSGAIDSYIDHYGTYFEGTQHELDPPGQYAMVCVAPERNESGQDNMCVTRNHHLPILGLTEDEQLPSGDPLEDVTGDLDDLAPDTTGDLDLHPACFDISGERNQTPAESAEEWFFEDTGPIFDVEGPVASFARSTMNGARWLLAMSLYWWINTSHPDVEESPAGVMWPSMLGLGLLVGTLLLIGRGIKMMIKREPGVLVSTLKGLGVFAIVCIVGIPVMGSLSHASESMTTAILDYGIEQSEQGCTEYQTSQPDEGEEGGLELDFPSSGEGEQVSAAEAYANCSAAQLYANLLWAPLIIVLYLLALIMMLVQAFLLFVREAALPIMALVLPVAAAGQLGGTTTKRWLPGLYSLIATLLLYKPLMAIIVAVGITQAALSHEIMDVLRGLITLFVGVIAPAVLFKAFKPIMGEAAEATPTLSSLGNNIFMGHQAASSIGGASEQRAAERATRNQAASQAAHTGGQVTLNATQGAASSASAATMATGPVGIAAKAGQMATQLFTRLAGKGGAEAGATSGAEAGVKGAQAPTHGTGTHPPQPPRQGQEAHPQPNNTQMSMRSPEGQSPPSPTPQDQGPNPSSGVQPDQSPGLSSQVPTATPGQDLDPQMNTATPGGASSPPQDAPSSPFPSPPSPPIPSSPEEKNE